MSFKQEIETWVKAVGQYDNHEFEEALRTFEEISDTAKILFNCGIIHATLGQHHKAVECYQRAIARDQFLAIAFFQQGVSNFLLGDFEEALANFNDTLIMLRGNKFINYEQLGLKYKLYSCTVLFNRGLCHTYMMQKSIGMRDIKFAAQEKETEEHDVIDEAIRDDAEGYTVFSLGVGTLYRPSSAKVKNLKSKDYLGKARLIASSEQNTNYIASSDPKRSVLAAVAERSNDDRAPESISFAASNLIRPNLHSRSRQQSEPPVNRNMFPPTPPPESEMKRPLMSTVSTSPPPVNLPLRDFPTNQQLQQQPQLRPEPLKLQKSTFTSLEKDLPQEPRLGTIRTASEPRGPSSRQISTHSREFHDAPPPRRLFMEAIPARPNSGGEADIDIYPDELLEMDPSLRQKPHSKSSTTSSRPRRHSRSRHPHDHHHPSIVEEDETAADDSSNSNTNSSPSSVDGFEMLHNAGGGLSRPPTQRSQSSRPTTTTTASRRARSSSRHGTTNRASSRPRHAPTTTITTAAPPPPPPAAPELRQLRVKVHHVDDTRYMMVAPGIEFTVFLEKVREKFALKGGPGAFKLKTKDEGDLITMGDADDWDMAVQCARREMVREGWEEAAGEGGMAKLEVWVCDVAAL